MPFSVPTELSVAVKSNKLTQAETWMVDEAWGRATSFFQLCVFSNLFLGSITYKLLVLDVSVGIRIHHLLLTKMTLLPPQLDRGGSVYTEAMLSS